MADECSVQRVTLGEAFLKLYDEERLYTSLYLPERPRYTLDTPCVLVVTGQGHSVPELERLLAAQGYLFRTWMQALSDFTDEMLLRGDLPCEADPSRPDSLAFDPKTWDLTLMLEAFHNWSPPCSLWSCWDAEGHCFVPTG